MSYFCTQIMLKGDGSFARSTTQHGTQDEAEMAFHSSMASIMGKAEYVKAVVIVIDEDGMIKFKRAWTRGQ